MAELMAVIGFISGMGTISELSTKGLKHIRQEIRSYKGRHLWWAAVDESSRQYLLILGWLIDFVVAKSGDNPPSTDAHCENMLQRWKVLCEKIQEIHSKWIAHDRGMLLGARYIVNRRAKFEAGEILKDLESAKVQMLLYTQISSLDLQDKQRQDMASVRDDMVKVLSGIEKLQESSTKSLQPGQPGEQGEEAKLSVSLGGKKTKNKKKKSTETSNDTRVESSVSHNKVNSGPTVITASEAVHEATKSHPAMSIGEAQESEPSTLQRDSLLVTQSVMISSDGTVVDTPQEWTRAEYEAPLESSPDCATTMGTVASLPGMIAATSVGLEVSPHYDHRDAPLEDDTNLEPRGMDTQLGDFSSGSEAAPRESLVKSCSLASEISHDVVGDPGSSADECKDRSITSSSWYTYEDGSLEVLFGPSDDITNCDSFVYEQDGDGEQQKRTIDDTNGKVGTIQETSSDLEGPQVSTGSEGPSDSGGPEESNESDWLNGSVYMYNDSDASDESPASTQSNEGREAEEVRYLWSFAEESLELFSKILAGDDDTIPQQIAETVLADIALLSAIYGRQDAVSRYAQGWIRHFPNLFEPGIYYTEGSLFICWALDLVDEFRTLTAIAQKQAASYLTRLPPQIAGAIEDKRMAAHDAFKQAVFNEMREYVKESIEENYEDTYPQRDLSTRYRIEAFTQIGLLLHEAYRCGLNNQHQFCFNHLKANLESAEVLQGYFVGQDRALDHLPPEVRFFLGAISSSINTQNHPRWQLPFSDQARTALRRIVDQIGEGDWGLDLKEFNGIALDPDVLCRVQSLLFTKYPHKRHDTQNPERKEERNSATDLP